MSTGTLLTVEEVAKRLHMSNYSVYRELESGNIRASKPKRRWLIPESAIEEYLARHSNEKPVEQPRRRRRRKWSSI